MPPQQQNQYDFIMQDSSHRMGSGPSFLQNPKNRIILAVGFVVIILTLVIIAVSVFSSLGKQSNNDMIEVLAYQTELVRIAELGLDDAKDPATRIKIATLSSFIRSDSKATTSYVSKSGIKLNKEDLTIHQDSSVEKDLESATQLNKYDETLLLILEEKIASYKKSLKVALDATTSDNRKTVLEAAAANIITFDEPATN